ncbi:MAG: hypothetical protein NBV68_15930 [Erythrobacter sp.]|uniref:hypothetical protein n=1 Tax=Erythrobacter sp. TaxID=1042 RepID=UPI0025D8A758|nr:hypothetical protein [Erythrobacter sp.]MCM0000868.1 hypothetical protein [Erythrobacter sp.]
MKRAVIVTGVLALLALLLARTASAAVVMFPPLWPLMLAPTAFLYLAGTWAVSALLPIRRVWLARGVALGIVVGVACLAVLPLRLAAIAEFEAQAQITDIMPHTPIVLTGNVWIEEGYAFTTRVCDDLCLTVLDLDRVTSVTVADPDGATTFRLVPAAKADPAAVAAPRDPGGFVAWGGSGGDSGKVNAHWQARLAGPERLVRGDPPPRANVTYRLAAREVRRGDTIIARWANAVMSVPIIPPMLGMSFSGADSGFAAGPLTLAYELREAGPFRDSLHPYAFFGAVLALKNYDGLPDPPSDQIPGQSAASSP